MLALTMHQLEDIESHRIEHVGLIELDFVIFVFWFGLDKFDCIKGRLRKRMIMR